MVSKLKERDLGFEELFNESWKLFKEQWVSMVFIAFIFLVLAVVQDYSIMRRLNPPTMGEVVSPTNIIAGIIVVLVYLIVTFAISLSIPIIVENAVKGQSIGSKQILQQSMARMPSFVWTSILSVVITFLLSLLLVIPGIIWMVYYVFMLEVVALRDLSGKKALDYSKALVKGRWWRIFGFFFFISVIWILLQLLVLGAFELLLVDTSSLASTVISSIFSSLGSVFFIVFATLFFLNLDYRRNNNDSTAIGEK